ncbi:hypothetical protein GBF38_000449, partial [Nibea albiflora]
QASWWLSCSTAVFLLLVHVGPVNTQSCGVPGIPGIPGTHGPNGVDGVKGEKGDPGFLVSSGSAVLELEVGDRVSLHVTKFNNIVTSQGSTSHTFTGFLIFPTA